MPSDCTDRKLQRLLCALQESGTGIWGAPRYEETLDEISSNPEYILKSGAKSYTITVLQGTVDVHGTTVPEGSWTFSAPNGGDFGQVIIDASGSTQSYIQAIHIQ